MGSKTLFAAILASLALLFTLPANAENAQDFGDYVVHFNALTTDNLPPSVTREYGITRSKHRALLNVAVLKKVLGTTGQPVAASVSAGVSNLTGQRRDIELREIREGSAIYYIGEFGVTHEDNLDFTVMAQPEALERPLQVQFQQRFFTR
jgi:hypothetical protein